MESCERCGDAPTILAIDGGDTAFCSVECMSKELYTGEDERVAAAPFFDTDAE